MQLSQLILSLLLFPFIATASPFVATVVHTKGQVKILKQPQAKSLRRRSEVLYEGSFYQLQAAKLGQKVKRGEVLQTGPSGRAKVIFANGDQISVGPGSSYHFKMKNAPGTKAKGGVLELFYGKVRAVISQKGPRHNMKVKTRSVVAGVRGTDFFVSERPQGTELTVLRGKIEVQQAQDLKKKEIVKTGHTAIVKKMASSDQQESKSPITLALALTPKNQLLQIQKASVISEPLTKESLSQEVQETIDQLNQKAEQNLIEEIKESAPEIFNKVSGKKQTSDEINSLVVSELYKQAPAGPEQRKPSAQDLREIGDVYKKYFE